MSTEKPFKLIENPADATLRELLDAHVAINSAVTALALGDAHGKTMAAFVLLTGERADLCLEFVKAIADAPSAALVRATQNLREAAANEDVREALVELVNLKSLKTAAGKTPEYELRQVRAWNIARNALDEQEKTTRKPKAKAPRKAAPDVS